MDLKSKNLKLDFFKIKICDYEKKEDKISNEINLLEKNYFALKKSKNEILLTKQKEKLDMKNFYENMIENLKIEKIDFEEENEIVIKNMKKKEHILVMEIESKKSLIKKLKNKIVINDSKKKIDDLKKNLDEEKNFVKDLKKKKK